MLFRRIKWRLYAAAAGGSLLFLESCDPTLRATTEDGIINVSTSLFGAFLRAIIELGQENVNEQTALLILDTAQRIVT